MVAVTEMVTAQALGAVALRVSVGELTEPSVAYTSYVYVCPAFRPALLLLSKYESPVVN